MNVLPPSSQAPAEASAKGSQWRSHAAGYDVAITARTVNEGDASSIAPETGRALPRQLADHGRGDRSSSAGAPWPCRLTCWRLATLAIAVDAAVAGLGGTLDVLVNNAIYVGAGNDRLFADCEPTTSSTGSPATSQPSC